MHKSRKIQTQCGEYMKRNLLSHLSQYYPRRPTLGGFFERERTQAYIKITRKYLSLLHALQNRPTNSATFSTFFRPEQVGSRTIAFDWFSCNLQVSFIDPRSENSQFHECEKPLYWCQVPMHLCSRNEQPQRCFNDSLQGNKSSPIWRIT